MPDFMEHPTAREVLAKGLATPPTSVDRDWLQQLCLEEGADDVGFVPIERPRLAAQKAEALKIFPPTRTFISFVCHLNRENIRSPARSIANLEYHRGGEQVNTVGFKIVTRLEAAGIRALNPAMSCPMETAQFPQKMWVISHKPIAVSAGLGRMGIHRSIIHPKLGSFILLGTILMAADVSEYTTPVAYNPCLGCNLCISACPVGALSKDGHFNFNSCYTHNYRELFGGFTDWVENVADSKNARDYRQKVDDAETVSRWQGLAFGPDYKSGYCIAACPAGEDVIRPFLQDQTGFIQEVVQPLRDKVETVYVIAGSDAEVYVQEHYPHKKIKRVHNGTRRCSVSDYVNGLPVGFQRVASTGLNATFHFIFTGVEAQAITVIIRDQKLQLHRELQGSPDLHITADGATWLTYIARDRTLWWAVLQGKIRLKGATRLLRAFMRCFPV